MTNELNLEQTMKDLKDIKRQVLELVKYSNPNKYAEFKERGF